MSSPMVQQNSTHYCQAAEHLYGTVNETSVAQIRQRQMVTTVLYKHHRQ